MGSGYSLEHTELPTLWKCKVLGSSATIYGSRWACELRIGVYLADKKSKPVKMSTSFSRNRGVVKGHVPVTGTRLLTFLELFFLYPNVHSTYYE